MTKPKDPENPKHVNAASVDPATRGWPLRLVSSRPPPSDRDLTLIALIGRLARCDHPKEAQSPAVVVEPDGSRLPISWCGACGAMRLPNEDGTEWIRTGLAQILAHEGHVTRLEQNLTSVVEGLAELTAAVRSLGAHSSEGDVASEVHRIREACVELEGVARATLQGVQRQSAAHLHG